MAVTATRLRNELSAEDAVRAHFYALLSRLYIDAPDAALLAAVAQAPPLVAAAPADDEAPAPRLPAAWDALRVASAAADPAVVREEYNDLFIGVGKSEVNLHASHWLTGFMMEKPLADLRSTLAAMGLGRREGVNLVEDHVAALFETMRLLVAGNGLRQPVALAGQRSFFERHIAPWIGSCCNAIEHSLVANYYRPVAQFTNGFMALERDSLAME